MIRRCESTCGFFLDTILKFGYTIYEKWCYRQTVFPTICYNEVTASVVAGRLLLFLVNDLYDQRDESDDDSTKLKQLGPCNHMLTPFSFESGAKKITPEMRGKPPTVTGSTRVRISQISSNIKKKSARRRIFSRSGNIPDFGL